ncbi:MAG: dephospho-CoA kinase [Hydrogenibacillus schlegelii]|nr:dephospho-CoA kinase [Hydrogenibacillus schlegelii]
MIVGLTGGIASGKSTAARLFAERGAAVVDADRLAREAVEPGTTALTAIVRRFGAGVLRPDGRLDRAALGRIVFRDAAARRDLEAIVHPEVRRRMQASIERFRAAGAPVIVLEVPLLFETGLDRAVDLTVVVYVDEAEQLRRLMARDGLDREEAEARLRAQLPMEEKRARADVVLVNRGGVEALARQIDALWTYAVRPNRTGQRKGNADAP